MLISVMGQMFTMDIDPMNTLYQMERRALELGRYPHLADEIVRRNPAFCQHVTDFWQAFVLTALAERSIPARLDRPVAFETFGHWGPWAGAVNWRGLAAARFINEASMLSWLISSYHIAGDLVHSQCCVLGLFCHSLRQSIPMLANPRKRLLWTRLHQLVQCVVCREARFEWGHGTTRQYLGLLIDRVSECLDYATYVLAPHLRELTLTQVMPMDLFCLNVRRNVLEQQLRQLIPIDELIAV